MSDTLQALKNLYVAEGGTAEDVADMTYTPDIINAIAGFKSLKDVTVGTADVSATYWGTAVSDMQENIAESGGAITGTLKYVASGALVTDWDSHHFIALKFADPNEADEIRVGILGSVALDADKDAVIAVTDKTKPLKVVSVKNGVTRTQTFDLSGLTLADA